ncbi:MAG: hypothetical protein F6K26_11360 [Moorea sp. SIO2I5]|nr:hypothetical protein [Moorena sp. SIO2I5]
MIKSNCNLHEAIDRKSPYAIAFSTQQPKRAIAFSTQQRKNSSVYQIPIKSATI